VSKPNPVAIAFWSYLAPISSSRALKWIVLSVIGILGMTLIGFFTGIIEQEALADLRAVAIVPGLPVAAALLSEMALRDGITHRTLLYPILGPVSRTTLAIIRTTATALILSAFALSTLIVLHVLSGRSWTNLPQELVAIVLGSFAYVCIFGLVHMWSKRGLVVALALFGIFDHSIGLLPFAIRKLSPSYYLRRLGDVEETLQIPIAIDMEDASMIESALILLLIAAVAMAITAFLFRRKPLGELC